MKKNQVEIDIENQNIGKLYLLCGEEDYLRNKMKRAIKQAVIGEEPSVNYAYYEGNHVVAKEVIAFADTLPFLADRRLVIVENCNLNKDGGDEWVDYLTEVSDTCCLVLVEKSVDKRSRLYKRCKEHGVVLDLDLQKDSALFSFVSEWLEENQCTMSKETMTFFLQRVSNYVYQIETELEKLRSYKMNPNVDIAEQAPIVITKEDVECLTGEVLENRIFQMLDAAMQNNQAKAFSLYQDSVALREPAMKILILLTRQIHAMLVIKDGARLKQETATIAKAAGVPVFAVSKSFATAKQLKYSRLKELLELGAQLEEDIKKGRVRDTVAVELLLSKCCE